MNKNCRELKPLSALLCEKISGRISLAKADFENVKDVHQAYDLYISGLECALKDLHDLSVHLNSLIAIAKYNQPLPF